MVDFGQWLAAPRLTTNLLRANITAARIAQKPSTILVARGTVELTEQTVRLETASGDRTVTGEGGMTHTIDAVVLGYKDHPSIPDTDLLPGDTFVVEGENEETDVAKQYRVIALAVATPGSLQAYVEVIT